MKLSYYSFFIIYSYLDDYGFFNGLIKRLINFFIPKIPPSNSFEYLIYKTAKQDTSKHLKELESHIYDESILEPFKKELDEAIVALNIKIQSFTRDKKVSQMLRELSFPIQDIYHNHELIDTYAQRTHTTYESASNAADRLTNYVQQFRREKGKLGTSLLLTFKTSKVLKYLKRLRTLLDVKHKPTDTIIWQKCINEFRVLNQNHQGLLAYFKENIDLLSLEIVEHTAQKGEAYIAWTNDALKKFFIKSMKAGIFIASFAVLKIWMDSFPMNYLEQSLFFSLNYALCFILVKETGGVIATKQPAMTASSIIKQIDGNNDLKIESELAIIKLYRQVTKSQLVSFIGNILIALPLAYFMANILQGLELNSWLKEDKIHKLVQQSYPIEGGAILFASVAGFFLAISGLISGYVDNKIIFTKLPHRIRNHSLLNKLLTDKGLSAFSNYIEKNSGTFAGNLSLGFLLGSMPLIQGLFGIPIDIRHIAFSSANFGFSLASESLNNTEISYGILGIFCIGLFNFLFSFLLTLILSLKSRGMNLKELLIILGKCGLDLLYHPTYYIPFVKVPQEK